MPGRAGSGPASRRPARRRCATPPGRPLNLGSALREELALLAGELYGELTFAAFEDVGRPAEHGGSIVDGNLAPRLESTGGRIDRASDIGLDDTPAARHDLVRPRRV